MGTLIYTGGNLASLLFWLVWGDFAWQIKERSAMPVVQVLLKKFEASDLLSGFLLAAIVLIAAPVASYQSDRYRGRWGRRVPFLLAPMPVIVATMALLAASPWLGERIHKASGIHSLGLNACTLGIVGVSISSRGVPSR